MAYRVIWHPDAKNDLAQLWLSARDRHRINEAAVQLDELLANRPLEAGESRADDERIVFIDPIACRFRVDGLRKLVEVNVLWRSR